MLILIGLNVALLLLGLGVLRGLIPVKFISNLMHGLHGTIGITPPTPEQVRSAVMVWIVSSLGIIDALYVLLLYAF